MLRTGKENLAPVRWSAITSREKHREDALRCLTETLFKYLTFLAHFLAPLRALRVTSSA